MNNVRITVAHPAMVVHSAPTTDFCFSRAISHGADGMRHHFHMLILLVVEGMVKEREPVNA